VTPIGSDTLISAFKYFLIAHAVSTHHMQGFLGITSVSLAKHYSCFYLLLGRVGLVEQQAVIRHIEHYLNGTITHLCHYTSAAVSCLVSTIGTLHHRKSLARYV
jgi:hypothetical protein